MVEEGGVVLVPETPEFLEEHQDKVEEDAVTVIPESLEIQETPEEIVNEEDVPNEDNVNNKVNTEKEDEGEEETIKAEKMFRFPLGTIKRIMKLDDDVQMLNQEAILCVTKATEFFIESLAKESFGYTSKNKKKTIMKNDVNTAIETAECLAFLDGAMEE